MIDFSINLCYNIFIKIVDIFKGGHLMDTKTTIISQKAANWWSMEIEQNATEDFVKGLDDFESQLSKEIQYTI